MSNEFAQDATLVAEFLVESEELLQGMDQDMVKLEATPKDADLLNRIFRALHTIKGTSGFLGFDPLVRLSHRAEDVLNNLRRGELELSRAMMDALLATRDQLGRMLEDIKQGGLKDYALDGLLADLEAVQKTVVQQLPMETNAGLHLDDTPPPAPVEQPHVESAISPQDAAAAPRITGEAVNDQKPAPAVPQPSEVQPPQKQGSEVSAVASTMRVDVRKLDELINLIGELVLERNRLVQLSRDVSNDRIGNGSLEAAFSESTARLSFVTDELQTAGLKARMVPIDTVFRKFPRLVRDLAYSVHKNVELAICGEDTELDKTMVELIADPLVHLVRNSLDHGIELPNVREAAGKPRSGTIHLEAAQEGDQIVITISDDGAGIDPERIAGKAVEKGLVTAERARGLSKKEILDFIFLPGFSTAEKVNNLSGRGVGMDVVRSNLKKLNGSVELDSQVGLGTTVRLHLPLTLAILPVLLVQVGEDVYALPLRSVVETACVNSREMHRVEGTEVLRLRDGTLPLLRLADLFRRDTKRAASDTGKVVIVGIGQKRVALLVDRLIGQESTVVKPLSSYLHHCSTLAGATISGDGRVRLVLDPAGLIGTLGEAAAQAAMS